MLHWPNNNTPLHRNHQQQLKLESTLPHYCTTACHSACLKCHLCFHSRFPHETALANSTLNFLPPIVSTQDKWHRFLQGRCSSCHPTNSIKAPIRSKQKIINCLHLSSTPDSWMEQALLQLAYTHTKPDMYLWVQRLQNVKKSSL